MKAIKLEGFGLTRGVRLNGQPLAYLEQYNFDWGYPCVGAKKLAYAILYQLYGDVHLDKTNDFQAVITNILPKGNFSVSIDVESFINAQEISKYNVMHAYSLQGTYVSDKFIVSRFIDFPNNNLNSGVFERGTLEHELLEQVEKLGFMSEYQEYCRNTTDRLSAVSEVARENASITKIGDVYHFRGGLGSEDSTGTVKNDSAYLYHQWVLK